ncbi:hypothetical protein FOIG_11477 [Fusarium odoratissimum NRRL 54006]|uniref:2EXR domain-containing protein n=1 Tax=Fusarium odoratissimum (strain NRRL 54006) TaxID=1089451 RepID=X0KGB7_FUSO5|nr:uncharacterized protein FOIG_11477 [Fusarium odoratissimum NRRL 54006]EXL95934.1 hypothetical protein FOIG_11477 [Fusarium odoratissimum NRRL 54006]
MEDPNQNPQVKPSGRLPSLLNPKFPISNATFHLFPNLPTELRQMIWEQSLTLTHTSLAHRRCLLQNRCLLPVAWATGSFSRQQDPRLIGQEVFHSVHFDLWSIEDFDKPYQTWMELAEKLRVTTPCAFKIAYTTNRSKSPIRCESDAVAYLNSESERWEQQLNKWEASQQEQAWRDPKETKRQSNGAVETAIGFWTFPIEPHGQFSRDYNRPKGGRRCFDDLSASRPELCLFDL